MAELNYDQHAPGGKIINIVHPHGPVYLQTESTRLRFVPESWGLSENWTIEQGELIGCGPDSLSLSAPMEILKSYSVCLFKDDPLSKGFFEATVRIPGIALGAAGLVVRFVKGAQPSGLALVLGGFSRQKLPYAALLLIVNGEVQILRTAQLKNYKPETKGLGIGLDFRPDRIQASVQGEAVFDLEGHEFDGAGMIGFIKFSSTSAWFADPRLDLRQQAVTAAVREPIKAIKGVGAAVKGIATKSAPRVFVSHSSHDKQFVRRLVEDLKKHDLKIWFDERELAVGDSIVKGISDGLKDTDYVVIVLSRSSTESKWVQTELNAALTNELSDKGTVILPALIEDCDLPPLLRDRKYADFRSDYGHGLRSLIEVFEEETKSAMTFMTSGIPPGRGTGASQITGTGGDCHSTLSGLTLANLRRRINDHLSRTELADVWFDTFGNEMDDEMPGKGLADCIRALIDRARKRSLFPALIDSLCTNRSDLGTPLNSEQQTAPPAEDSILKGVLLELPGDFSLAGLRGRERR